jgi:hypothetical protein
MNMCFNNTVVQILILAQLLNTAKFFLRSRLCPKIVEKYPAVYTTRGYIAVFTTARYVSLS